MSRFVRAMRFFVCLLAIVLVVRAVFVESFEVTTRSMEPLLRGRAAERSGQRLVVDKTAFEWRDPRRWEVVVFRPPGEPASPFVKRIVGLPNESVQIKDGEIYVDGERTEKPIGVRYLSIGRHGTTTPYRLGPDEYFVLGDNTADSDDSRFWPMPGVKRQSLIGRVIYPWVN